MFLQNVMVIMRLSYLHPHKTVKNIYSCSKSKTLYIYSYIVLLLFSFFFYSENSVIVTDMETNSLRNEEPPNQPVKIEKHYPNKDLAH